jgi:hypothetical protein
MSSHTRIAGHEAASVAIDENRRLALETSGGGARVKFEYENREESSS